MNIPFPSSVSKSSMTSASVVAVTPIPETHHQTTRSVEPLNAGMGVTPLFLAIVGIVAFVAFLKTCLQICNPNEILILSGRQHKTKKGESLGYKVIFGGRAVVIPILEQVERMDMTTMPVPVEVRNAYSKGGIPLHIQAIANVKVSSNPSVVGNAIERFLGHNRNEIKRVARETLEGNLRGIVADLTPEQVNEDRLQFAERIAQDVSRDLSKLGLHLDTLKIQNVSDDVDYLNSIGRQQIAQIVRDAEIAEAQTMGEADRIEADCEQQAEVAKSRAQTVIQQKRNELRKVLAELEQRARSEEELTQAAAKEAQARAEQQLQSVRAELERLRLDADQVLPAEAQRLAQELQARGDAAALAENAKAAALVNNMLAAVWHDTGVDATQVFLLQQIEMILQQAATIPKRMTLERVNIIDNGDGKALASLLNVYPEIVRQFLARVDDTLGLDVTGTLNRQRSHVADRAKANPGE